LTNLILQNLVSWQMTTPFALQNTTITQLLKFIVLANSLRCV